MSEHSLHLRELQTEAMDAPTYTRADMEAAVKRALMVAANRVCHPSNLDDLGPYGSPVRLAAGDRAEIIAIRDDPAQIAAIVEGKP